MIYIKKGIYHEKLVIEKSNLRFIGESVDETIITFNNFAKKQWNKSECYKTFRSYTTFIGGDYLTFENLTFKNEAGKGSEVGQALAAYVDGNYLYFKAMLDNVVDNKRPQIKAFSTFKNLKL